MGTKRRASDQQTQRDRDVAGRDQPADAPTSDPDAWGFDLAVEDDAFWAAFEHGGLRDRDEPEATDFWPEEDGTDEGEASR